MQNDCLNFQTAVLCHQLKFFDSTNERRAEQIARGNEKHGD